MSENTDVQASGGMKSPQSRRHLRHLHQRVNAFVHSGPAAGARDDDQRKLLAGGLLDAPRQLLADDRAHASHDEAAIGEPQDDSDAFDKALADDGRLVQTRSAPARS